MEPSWRRFFGRQMKGHLAFINALLRFKKIEMLWNRTQDHMSANGESPYSHYLLTRDDIYWIDDVDMSLFTDPLTVYSTPFNECRSNNGARASDHALVLGREAASRFFPLYSEYYHNPSKHLDAAGSVEEFLQVLAKLKGLTWELVAKDQLPSFLAVHKTNSASLDVTPHGSLEPLT